MKHGQARGEQASRKTWRGAIAVAIATAALLALTAAPALANTAHAFSSSFAAPGSGDGQVSLASNSGVAVNNTSHDVYVADTANARIDQFSSAGAFIRAWGADVGGAGVNTCTTGCVAGTPGSGPGAFTTPAFVAVDNSATSASQGDVYVGDTNDNVVTKFDASGTLVSAWGSGGQLDGSTATDGPFGPLAGIAVDTSGNLFAYDTNSQLFEFAQDGTFVTDFSTPFATNPVGVGLDSAANIYKVRGFGFAEKLDSSGNDLGAVDPSDSNDTGLAVNPANGDIYIDNSGTAIDHYSSSSCQPTGGDQSGCTPAESFGSAQLSGAAGLAVDSSSGSVYAADASAGQIDAFIPAIDATTGSASNVAAATATLSGTVNPDGSAVTSCRFEYVSDAAFNTGGFSDLSSGGSQPCAETVGSGTTDVPVHADVSNLSSGTTYHFRLVASDALATARGDAASFSTLPLPSIDFAAAQNLTPTDADLVAKINPNGLQLSDCHFEWGTDPSYGQSADCSPDAASIPADSVDHAVTTHLTGLTADTTYHWRIIATDANGTVGATVDHTFIYPTTGGSLPDNRAYEMVTPAQKNGALIGDVSFLSQPPDIAASGSGVIASVVQCFSDAGSCDATRNNSIGQPYSFTRTSAGWVTKSLSPPATDFPVASQWSYSADGNTALFSAPTPPAGEDDFYGRMADGTLGHIGPVTPPGQGAQGPLGVRSQEQAQTADLSHFVWQTLALWPFDAGNTPGVYEYTGTDNTQPLLVGVSGGHGSTDLVSACGTALGGLTASSPPGRLSADGHTVYFTASPCPSGSGANSGTPVPAYTLYARIDGEGVGAHTVQISGRSPSDCTGGCQSSVPSDGQFVGASADGSKAFFASTQQLTDDASEDSQSGDTAGGGGSCAHTSGPNGCNLYLYDFANPAGHELIDVSAGDSSGGGPRFQGAVAISGDGSHIYFVAKGVLTTTANNQGRSAADGANNLYLYERDATHPNGHVAFVASLPGGDSGEWQTVAGDPANTTPDGRYLVFLSHADLTPDDTSRSGAQQVFRYDAETGELIRSSIGNDGFNDNGNRSGSTPCGPIACSEDAAIAFDAARPGPTMSTDGAYVFFDSPVGLTPRALDDVQIATDAAGNPVYADNVYEWHAGHVYLISDGRDVSVNRGSPPICPGVNFPSSVCLLGTDATGSNVFFSTADPLTPQDGDTELDYYDARVGGGFPFTPPPVPCSGDNCKPAPSAPPTDQTPGSGTASDAGNLTPNRQGATTRKKCKKHRKRKCKKSRKSGARAAGTTRRAGR